MIRLYNEDTRDVLRRMPDESVDCIITDPPYRTISGGEGGYGGRPSGMLSKNDGKVFEHNDIDFGEYMGDLFRVLSDPGHMWIFTNEMNRRRMEDAILGAGFKIHYLGGWVKNNKVVCRWGMKNCEPFFMCRKGPARSLYTPSLPQFIHRNNVRGKTHPTEKPLDLMHDMVKASSQPGEIIFDPFMGTGATGVAARQSGRSFIGVEIDPKHYRVAAARIGEMPL